MIRFGKAFSVSKDESLEEANKKLYKEVNKLLLENLKATNRTETEEKNSHMTEK